FLLIVRLYVNQCKRPDDKLVVAGFTFQSEHSGIVIDRENIRPVSAVGCQRPRSSPAKITGDTFERLKLIIIGDAVFAGVKAVLVGPGRIEQLSNLESIASGSTIQRGYRTVIVDGEVIIAAMAANDQSAVDILIVVNAFYMVNKSRKISPSAEPLTIR
ncbi:MAG: hypothetical protein ACYSYL_03520, partial [Planctomycetota bacterium]